MCVNEQKKKIQIINKIKCHKQPSFQKINLTRKSHYVVHPNVHPFAHIIHCVSSPSCVRDSAPHSIYPFTILPRPISFYPYSNTHTHTRFLHIRHTYMYVRIFVYKKNLNEKKKKSTHFQFTRAAHKHCEFFPSSSLVKRIYT